MKEFYSKSSNKNHTRTVSEISSSQVFQRFSLLALVFLLLSVTGLKAVGLSGTYTIDPAGSGSTNYTTFALATSALTTNGVSGPVVFNVAATTFSTTVTVGAITGASSTNTIIFRGKGRGNTTITTTGSIITLTGANYVTFDQMSLTTTATSGNIINAGSTTGCGITNCKVTVGVSGSSYVFYANNSVNFTIFNNYVYGGYYGVYTYGVSNSAAYGGLNCTYNRFIGLTYAALYSYYTFQDNFSYNVVDSAYSTLSYGLYMYYMNGPIINGNKLYEAATYGYYEYYVNYYPVTGRPVTAYITNNFITNFSTYGCYDYAMYLNVNTTGGWVCAHNTFYNASATYCALYYPEYDGPGTITFADNIYYSVGGTYALYFYPYSSMGAMKQMDGNDIYFSTGSIYFYDGATTYTFGSYAAYAAQIHTYGWDLNGTNFKPTFKSLVKPFDLHLATTTAGPPGVWAGITTDIDLNGRFRIPTAGANESYFGVKNDNAGVVGFVGPKNFCPGNASISVDLADLGLNAITTVQVGWSWDGVVQTPVTYNSTIPLYGDAIITLGSQSFSAGVSHKLKAWPINPNGNSDTKASDDTLYVNAIAPSLSGTFTINPGGSGTSNFTTFGAAAAALSANGICGPVLFKVSNGSYNEQVFLNNVTGTSSTNTITFDGGDSSKTSISTNSAGDAFKINATNYVTLKRLGIYSSSVSSPTFGVHITGGSSYNTVTSCIVKVDTNTTTSGVTALGICGASYSTSDAASYNQVINNDIRGGYMTLSVFGSGSTSMNPGNNIIRNKISRGYQYSVYFYYQSAYLFSKNVITTRPGSTISGYGCYFIYSANCTVDGNIFSANYMPVLWEYIDYSVTGGTSYFTNNIMYGQYYTGGGYTAEIYYAYASKVYHNTFYNTLPTTGYCVYLYNSGTAAYATDFRDNIIVRANSNSVYGLYVPATSYVSNCDYNDYYGVTGGNFVQLGSVYSDLPSLKAGVPTMNQNSVVQDPGFANTTYGSENFHMCKTCYGVAGTYVGINTDIDGDTRCKLFPNMGADETSNGKGKPVVKFFITSNIYPGSPSYVYQTNKPGSPTKNAWYLLNSSGVYVKISDSVVLLTSKFTVGSNTLKLVTQTCGGNDSFTQTFTVAAPTAVPVTDFVSNKNAILVNDVVSFQDLSSNGPQTWNWKVTPDSIISGGAKVPTTKYIFPTVNGSRYQNPQIQFLFAGKYQVCLSTTNGVGKGNTNCKMNYITVLPTVNIGKATVTDASGYLYDDGGPTSPYITNGGAPSTVIAPCADSVYLVFTMFDVNCNVGFVQLYEGTNAKGRRLDPCGSSGLNSGFTGGPSGAACSTPCMPNVTKPDTFKAKTAMFIQMNDGATSANAKGFSAFWWSKPSTSKKPKAGFTQTGSGDSVCVNAQVTFTNTASTNNPNDPISVLWDLDGDPTSYECIGTCATAIWPYFLTGQVAVTMIATNCGGSDTFSKTLTVYSPKTPKTKILADNTNPTTTDVVFMTAPIVQCVDDYNWTFTKSSGYGSGIALFLNGTSNTSAAPQVSFSDTGYYDVTLAVDNLSGAQKDNLTIKNYIHVRAPYCIPSVATLNQGMGISGVTLNTINNTTTQAAQEYTNFAGNQSLSTSLAVGATYTITISRNPNLVFENLNRSVFIDWNEDGSFAGKGELAASDSNSSSNTFTGKITIPKTAKLGATIMRIAVNRGAYSNKPCGQNEFGEYQDYRVYIIPYNILPVITLKGHQGLKDTIKIEQGNPFVEAGYSATSFLYGNMTNYVKRTSRKLGSSNVADSFNMVIPNIYVFSYNVSDSAGNKAITQYRIVQVTKDKTPPALIVAKPDTTVMEVTATPLTPFPAPKVISADDLVDGPLAGSVINDANKVTSNILGKYTITYSVTDLSGNTSIVYRYVRIIDTIAPAMKLVGSNPITLEVKNSFKDPGVSTSDNYYNSSVLNALVVVSGNVDTSKVGTYTITYNLSDPSRNKALTLTRTVKVIDSIKPVISLVGPQTDSVDVFTNYTDPGVSYSDNYSAFADIAYTVGGTYYKQFPGNSKANLLGAYTIIYTVTDKSGNSASVTRNVKVVDHVAPKLVLIGSATVTVCRWFKYVDAGVNATDNYDKPSDITLTMISTGNTDVEGLFSVRYQGVDKSGNIGFSPYRYVLVNPANSPACTSGIETGLSLDKYISIYPNPNSGLFNINANLPSVEKVRINVTNMLGQEIAVVHNGNLGTNNFQVDLTNQVNGIYMINIVSNNQTVTKRIEILK